MPTYRELAPPPQLADAVECFWLMDAGHEAARSHRVVPDGCADLLFTRECGRATLQVVGAMTRFEDFALAPRQSMLGVRFRPGMWRQHFGLPGDRITDRIVTLDDLWGARGRHLLQCMGEARSFAEAVPLVAAALAGADARTPLQRAIGFMEQRRGCVALDAVARAAGLSSRQFRRLCLDETGLSPKLLARVLRFRHALAHVRLQAGEHAGLAADCGYTDQSHFIADFRRFSGQTPGEFVRTQPA